MLPFQRLPCAVLLLVAYCHAANIMRPTQTGPRIEIKPSTGELFFEAQGSASKVLTCKALGDKPGMFNNLRWTGPDSLNNWEELKKRHTVKESTRNGYSIELQFNSPKMDDSGVYYCLGTYQSSDYLNTSVKVTFYNPIKFECPERQYVIEDEPNQKISCQVSGDGLSPLVVYKNEQPIDPKDSRYKWDEEGLRILKPADQTDVGTYMVEAKSEITGDRQIKNIAVEVNSKPGFVPYAPVAGSMFEFTAVEGERAELKCDVTGKPRPLVYWFDPRKRDLTKVGGYHPNLEQGTLIIDKVNRVDDDGNFECVARNHIGEERRNVSLGVLVRPQIVKFENTTAEDGREVVLECRATGHPRPVFTIRKYGINQLPYRVGDGFVTDLSEGEEGGGAQVYVYRVKIKASRNTYGTHYCNATNLAGPGPERSNHLFVSYKPDLSSTPKEQYARLGKEIALTCHIRAYPAPKVKFSNDLGQDLLNVTTKFSTSPDDQTHILTMQPPISMLRDSSRFKCIAENQAGVTEQMITFRYTKKPGTIIAEPIETTPTTAKVHLSVNDDGGELIRAYEYRADGRSKDLFNPIFTYPIDKQNASTIDAVASSTPIYTIRNLLPNYEYRISIRAINDVGPGDWTEFRLETKKPAAPTPPIIVKPSVVSSSQIGFPSDYKNGYVLRWIPPELDNGDPVNLYRIKFYRVDPDSPNSPLDDGDDRTIEQTNERPLHVRLGPLETNRHYKIEIRATNKYGDSKEASIHIVTNVDRPMMPDFEPMALSWLTEPSTPVLVGLLVLAIISLIIIDIIFCFCFQLGVSHSLRGYCCPTKANSVISDKTYS